MAHETSSVTCPHGGNGTERHLLRPTMPIAPASFCLAGLVLLSGSISGQAREGAVCLSQVVIDRPATRAGMQSGDCLVTVDESPLDPAWLWLSDEVTAGVRRRVLEIRRGDEPLSVSLGPGSPGWTLDLEGDHGEEARRLLSPAALTGRDNDGIAAALAKATQLVGHQLAHWWLAETAEKSFDSGQLDLARSLWTSLLGSSPGLDFRARYGLARIASRRGDHDGAAESYDELRERLPEAAKETAGLYPELVEAWVLEHWSRAERTRGDLDRSVELAERSLALRQEHAPGSLAEAASQDVLAAALFRRGELDRVEEIVRSGLERCRQLDRGSALEADLENDLGLVFWGRGDLEAAARRFEASLAIVRRVLPDSLRLAIDFNNLGLAAWNRGLLEEATAYHRQALELRRRLDPGGLTVAASLTNLGNVLFDQGKLREAEEAQAGSLEIMQRLAPDHLDTGHALNNLANVSAARGDWSWARELYLKALAIRERRAPQSTDVALTLNNLGAVAEHQGELDAAQRYLEEALEIYESVAPDSHLVALTLGNLGGLADERGEFELARDYQLQAIETFRRHSPGTLGEAFAHHNLGRAKDSLGDLGGAIEELEAALEIVRRQAPGSLDEAGSLHFLGLLLRDTEDQDRATTVLAQALEIRERLAPATIALADSLNTQGHLAADKGDVASAEDYFSRAVDEVEKARWRAGGTSARTQLATKTSFFFHDLAVLEARQGRAVDALSTLERGRARSLQEMLAEHDLDWRTMLSPELAERHERLSHRRRQLEDRLGAAAVGAAADLDSLHAELAAVRSEEDALLEAVRRQDPAFAAIAYPQALEGEALAESLGNGRLALVVSVGSQETLTLALRVLASGQVEGRSHIVELGSAELDDRVSILRLLLAAPAPHNDSGWKTRLADLRQQLTGPFADWLSASTEVLWIPDAALHQLPPTLLASNISEDSTLSGPPVFTVPSLGFYAELERRPRPATIDLAWAGFGDPVYARPKSSPATDAGAALRSPPLAPLPGSRSELERVKRSIAGPSRLYLGADATEEAARSLPPAVRIVHFASHGLVDHRSPASSSIALSSGTSGDRSHDGLLQAWEIIESLDLETDLVVLSACDTGLGQIAGSEGLLGLSRAFLLAGARSLLVSLWPISDRASALFMEHFYDGLIDGLSKDEALRQAQRALEASDEFQYPYYWAAFELVGDPSPLQGIERHRRFSLWQIAGMALVALVVLVVLARSQLLPGQG